MLPNIVGSTFKIFHLPSSVVPSSQEPHGTVSFPAGTLQWPLTQAAPYNVQTVVEPPFEKSAFHMKTL
jgi:hypothetical protein